MINPKEIKLYIAVPVYGMQMLVPFVTSLFALSQRLAKLGINHEIKFIGDSLIPRLRNTFACSFLDTDCTHLLFLDCDLEFPADAILHMLDMEKELIGCAYTRKEINWNNVAKAAAKGLDPDRLSEVAGNIVAVVDEDTTAEWDAPMPVAQVGTGLMLIKRCVFEKLREAMPELEYDVAKNEPTYKLGKKAWDFFGCYIAKRPDGNYLLSEDYAFCDRLSNIGVQTWLLTCHRTVHWGMHGHVFNMPQLTAMELQPELNFKKLEPVDVTQ